MARVPSLWCFDGFCISGQMQRVSRVELGGLGGEQGFPKRIFQFLSVLLPSRGSWALRPLLASWFQ